MGAGRTRDEPARDQSTARFPTGRSTQTEDIRTTGPKGVDQVGPTCSQAVLLRQLQSSAGNRAVTRLLSIANSLPADAPEARRFRADRGERNSLRLGAGDRGPTLFVQRKPAYVSVKQDGATLVEGEGPSEHSESGGSSGPSVSERSDKGTAPPPTKLSPGASLTIDDVAVEVRKTMAYMVLYQGKKDVRGLHRYVPVSAVGAPEKGDFGPKLGTHGSLLFAAEAIQKAIADEMKGARSGGGVSLDALADRIVPLKTADFLEAAKAYFPGKNHKDFETTTGFNEAGMVFIDVDKSTDVGTLIHEAVHLYAPNNFPDAFGNYLNEGTTEYFARQVITKLGLGLKRSKYEPEFVVASVLTSKVSEGVMKKAFLGGDIDALKGAVMGLSEEVESGSGEKRWKEFSRPASKKMASSSFLTKPS